MKQTQKIIQPLIASIIALSLNTACGPGVQNKSAAVDSPVTNQAPGAVTPTANWQAVSQAMDSTVSGGPMNSYPLIQIDSVAQTVELLIPFSFSLGLGSLTPILPGSISIASVQGVTISPVTLPDGSSGWAVSVPLKYLLQQNGAGLQPLATLPNGSPLPSFPSAEIRGIAISLPQQPTYQINLYIALKAVAVFVSVPGVNLPIGLGYNLVNQDKTRNIGYVALIPTSGVHPAGVYVAAQIPTDVSLALNSLVSF